MGDFHDELPTIDGSNFSEGGFGVSSCPVSRQKPGGRLILKVTTFVGSAKSHTDADDMEVLGVLDSLVKKEALSDNFC